VTTESVKTGDVFEVPTLDGRIGYGQIAKDGEELYIVIFKALHEGGCALETVHETGILLCGWTLDALIYHGQWKIVGNAALKSDIPKPCYKVSIDGTPWIESFDGDLQHKASDREWSLYDFRATIAPIRYERAFSAFHGLAPWEPPFDKLLVEYARERQMPC
jgi:hypothetical protein